jgi:cobaltochelatase CobS
MEANANHKLSHQMMTGDKFDTRYGVVEIKSSAWVSGSGRKRKKVFTVYSERYARHFEWSARKMAFARKAYRQQRAEATETSEQRTTDEVTTEAAKATPAEATGSLAEMLGAAIGPYVASKIDRDDVVKIIDERLTSMTMPRRVEVVSPVGETKDVGVQHAMFDALLRLVANRLNTWLVGPAGSGKTSVASAVAEALDLPFYSTSVCAMTSKSDLVGYRNVSTGEYVETDLRRAYEHGGVFLLDEVDAGNPNVMVVLNNLMANGHCSYPDGMVAKHDDFILLAGANTVGLGADSQYVGRNQLDKATLDRFVLMPFGYDPAIEAAMTGLPASCFSDMPRPEPIEFLPTENAEGRCELLARKIVAIRRSIDELKVRHIVSPRATKAGVTMLRAGFPMDTVMQWGIWKGLDSDTVSKVCQHANLDSIC